MTQDHTQVFIVGCPACQKEIKVLPHFAGEIVQCPYCSKSMRVPDQELEIGDQGSGVGNQTAPTQAVEPKPLDDLLPPKYQSEDPAQASIQTGSKSVVVLPTASGGTQTVDQNTVTIEYKGQKYVLTKLTPEQRERRRQIANVVSIIIAIVAIAVTIWILLG